MGSFRKEDRPRCSQGLHAGGEVGSVPHGGIIHAQIIPDPANDYYSRV